MNNFIKRVSVGGLFETGNDYLIEFESGSNCFFGDNGTGKTTLINLIVAVLTGDIGSLSEIDFEFIEVTTVKDDLEHIISVFKSSFNYEESDAVLKKAKSIVTKNKLSYYAELTSDFSTDLTETDDSDFYEINYDVDKENISFQYPGNEAHIYFSRRILGSRKHKLLMQALNERINLTHVPLLRVKNNDWEVLGDDISRQKRWNKKIESSRFDASTAVLHEIESSFMKMAGMLTRRDNKKLEDFKSQIVQKFLVGEEIISSTMGFKTNQSKSNSHNVNELFEKLKSAGLQVPIEKLNENFETLDVLFEKTEKAIKNSEKIKKSKISVETRQEVETEVSTSFIKLLVARTLFERFESILNDVEQLQIERNSLWDLLNDYERIVNKFLNNKSFSIKKDGSFEVFSGARRIDLKNLSSGEKHIIALLGRAALSGEKGSVFIADEPELSLHLTWQRMMLPSILELSPKSQIIVATHSPAIIPRESNKIDLGEL